MPAERDEVDKWAKAYPEACEIRDFLEWLSSKGIVLASFVDGHDYPAPYPETGDMLLYRYFEIDYTKLEAQRRALLEEARVAGGF